MKYISTRGQAPVLGFDDAVLAGLARDGGLYVPDRWPTLTAEALRGLRDLDYAELTARIVAPFAEPSVTHAELLAIARDAYRGFDHPETAPLTDLGDGRWLLELFHGPTLAFKDYALQILGRLFDLVLGRRGERLTIVGATSGDTGSAAIEACRDRAAVDIFILFPHGRVSEVQRRQMTTVDAPNVHTIAIDGTFDDCQDLVKAMFNDTAFRDRMRLGAVNSINWARIVAQVVYYVHAALRLGAPERRVVFSVPTGNFGNVFAGYAAACMGLPIAALVVGSNRNDILTRFFASGRMEQAAVVPTISPSMDIQISSNFERLLFDLYDRDGAAVRRLMTGFRETGVFAVDAARLKRATGLFRGARFDDDLTREEIRRVHDRTGMLVDPHSAIGLAAARVVDDFGDAPVVALATAHAAKFPDAVAAATGIRPALPPRLADLLDRPERTTALANDLSAIEAFIADRVAARGVAA
jgi:threonine synthase